MRTKNLLILFAALFMGCFALSCEDENNEGSNNPNNNGYFDEEIRDDSQDKGEENKQDNLPGNNDNKDDDTTEQVVLNTEYQLYIDSEATSYTTNDGTLRNDYISFYDPATDATLFIDFYSAATNTALAEGRYELGAAAEGCCSQDYTYFMVTSSSDFERFAEGYAEVKLTSRNRYTIVAEYTLLSGKTVGMVYNGRVVYE